jgi:putative ABC transport system permease protein
MVVAAACIWWTLRSLGRISERSLLAGEIASDGPAQFRLKPGVVRLKPDATPNDRRAAGPISLALALVGVGLLTAGAAGVIDQAAGFFGAGSSLLAASLGVALLLLRRRSARLPRSHGRWAVLGLGVRNATYRPGRSVLSMAVIASATFILISVDAFRRDTHAGVGDRRSGLGGYAVAVDTVLPIAHDPDTVDGREALNLIDLDKSVSIEPFRVRPGDDASCLNLYEPRNPRILAPRDSFLAEGRFVFAGSLASTDAEHENPWRLLQRREPDGAIPVIADANSMTYVLHRALGDEMAIPVGAGTARLRLVAALRDSILQGELIMSQENFLRLFPEQEGYGLLLVDAPAARVAAVTEAIERGLTDYGADAVGTAERLAEFHRVENTYLSTFQTLGGLGLLLGTVGLAAVLLRNVLERRRELALLGAVGYGRSRLFVIVVAESALLLVCGLAAGAVCAIIATIPAAAAHGGRPPIGASGWLMLFAVFATGLISSIVATRAAVASRLLDALRTE